MKINGNEIEHLFSTVYSYTFKIWKVPDHHVKNQYYRSKLSNLH